jgi:hypothetical protein
VGLLLAADIQIEPQLRWNLSSPQSGSNLREQAFPPHPFYATKTVSVLVRKTHPRLMMSDFNERGRCRFNIRTVEGNPSIEIELLEDTLRQLATMELRFEVRSGITLESARNVAELMNDFINALIVTRHPERLATFARR